MAINTSGDSIELFWDLATFQANANIVLPYGTRIYYKKGNGQITGIYKISDGVNTIANLPLFFEQFNLAPYESINYSTNSNILWSIDSINSFLYPGENEGRRGIQLDNTQQIPVVVHFPINVIEYAVNVKIFGLGGTIRIAFYSMNNDSTGTYIPNSVYDINIDGVGIKSTTITPLFLEPGIYYALIKKLSGSFAISINNKKIYDVTGNLLNSNILSLDLNPPPLTIDKLSMVGVNPSLYLKFQKVI